MKLKLLSKLFLLVFILPNVTHAQPKIELDVKTIMQDPKTWVGSAPNGSVKSSMKERVLVIKVEGGGDAFLRHVRSCVNH